MKKVSTVAGEAEQEYFSTETDHRTGSGRPDAWKHLLWDCLRISCRLRHLCLELNSTEDAWFGDRWSSVRRSSLARVNCRVVNAMAILRQLGLCDFLR